MILFLQGTIFFFKCKYRKIKILALWGKGRELSETKELTVAYGGHIICQALCSIHLRSCFLAFKLLCNPLSLNVDSYLGLAYN